MTLTHYNPKNPQNSTAWGALTWLVGREWGNSAKMTLGRVTILPGEANPRHSHPSCEEILHLFSGTMEHSIGQDHVIMNSGDTICVPAGVYHNARNIGSETADMVVAFSSADRDFKKE